MASSVSSLFSSSNTPGATTPPGANSSAAPNEQMFLKLLVSQIQNQDPLNPTDSTQFVSQLAQFSQLEQLIAIRGDMDSNQAAAANGAGATGNGAGSTGNGAGAAGSSGLPGSGSTGTGSTNSNTTQGS